MGGPRVQPRDVQAGRTLLQDSPLQGSVSNSLGKSKRENPSFFCSGPPGRPGGVPDVVAPETVYNMRILLPAG